MTYPHTPRLAAVDMKRSEVATPAILQNIPWEVLKPYLAKLVWSLYDEHANDSLLTVKKWFISITVRVSQIRPLLESWFGPHP